jgi:hypothetical protein
MKIMHQGGKTWVHNAIHHLIESSRSLQMVKHGDHDMVIVYSIIP